MKNRMTGLPVSDESLDVLRRLHNDENISYEGDLINGYSKWNNDIKRGEQPRFVEGNTDCSFIKEATRTFHDNLRDGRGMPNEDGRDA